MKIKILAKEYQVELVSTKVLNEGLKSEDNEEVYGIHIPATSKILINNCLDLQEQRLTIVHEVLHAIYGQYGDIFMDQDEEHINRLSTAITQVLLDNPTFTQMFLER